MNTINDILGRITTSLQSQFTILSSFMVRIQNFGTQVAQVVQQKVQKFVQTMTKDPASKSDYWKVLGLYFSKKLVIMSAVIIGVVGYALIYWVYPWADGKLWTADIRIDTAKLSSFEGRARLYDTSNVKIYEGNVKMGRPNGEGSQYDTSGNLVYKGNFESGKYSGEGQLYDSDGTLVYDGKFVNNMYEGEGKLYNSIGKVIYIGNFSGGRYGGVGIEYNPDTGVKTYYGDHSGGVRSGQGTEYESDGNTILYEGNFKDGKYGGNGKLYSHSTLLYMGNFEDGAYSGRGDLYDLDTGVVRYSGEFKNGLYDGDGILYNVNTSVMEYSGAFSKGKKQGVGTYYDTLGSKKFSGNFRGDSIDYIGYLGADPDKISSEFGQESYRTEVDNRLIITYLNHDASIIFKVDETEGEYVCEKIILGIKEQFMGLGAQSTAVERRSVMGEPFSSINYSCPDYYRTVFSNLAINIDNVEKVPSDKYIMENYFIRFYFNEGRTELKCIEICNN